MFNTLKKLLKKFLDSPHIGCPEYCPYCGGTGFNKYWVPCQHCGTTGYVPKKKGGAD